MPSMAPAAAPPAAPLLLPCRRAGYPGATARASRAASLIAVRAQPDTTSAASSSSTSAPEPPLPEFKPPPGFKTPEPKRFEVKDGQQGSVLGASLAIPLRLGTGVFVLGYRITILHYTTLHALRFITLASPITIAFDSMRRYSPSFVSPSEIPSDQYALEFGCEFVQTPFLSVLSKGQGDDIRLGPRCIVLPLPSKRPNIPSQSPRDGWKETISLHGMPPSWIPGYNFSYTDTQWCVDPNTGVAMYESDDIIKYLADTYGDGTVPIMLSLGLLTAITAGLATLGRLGRGNSYTASKIPPKPIEIWAYEGSPFCRLVREVLVELELPHLLHRYAQKPHK
ncbi:hypothetical protein HU200_062130 [Digitaria exilis]|uniref:GST N-terminal domain-containing protein n=1 Tax=Digitaria exilis TaxID=1010633 RepID=A0A835A6L3_9POAL|nr:hypothetical protein HU200_062130 [Digitaria exilis]